MKKHLFAITALLLMVTGALAQSDRPTTQINAEFMNADPYPLMTGDDADVRLVISNDGNSEARNVQVSLKDSFPFQVKPDRKRNYTINSLRPGQEYYISTEVLVNEDAPDGMNDLKVGISHGDFSKVQDVPVEVEDSDVNLNVANLKTSPSDLKPATDSAELTMDVVNNGEKPAENAVIDISLPYGFEGISSLSTRQAVGNLPPGETRTAKFRFDINESAPKGMTSFPVNISFSDSGNDIRNEVVQKNFDLYVSGSPRFELEAIETDLTAGEKREVRIKVRNTGEEDSESTRIRVLENADQPFSFSSKSSFIGTLEPNSTGSAVFEVTTDSSAPDKSYIMEFETRGVSDDQVFVENEVLRAQVEEPPQNSNPVFPAVAVVLVSLAGVAFFFRQKIRELVGI